MFNPIRTQPSTIFPFAYSNVESWNPFGGLPGVGEYVSLQSDPIIRMRLHPYRRHYATSDSGAAVLGHGSISCKLES